MCPNIRCLSRLFIAMLCFTASIGLFTHRVFAEQPLPVFDYPINEQTLDYEGDYLFRVEPVSGATNYLWGFFQENMMVWENFRDEHSLSPNEYGIMVDTQAHTKFKPGMVKVSVRALIKGDWTDATVITIYLKSNSNASLIDKIKHGEHFWVALDATSGKFDDSAYTGHSETDPLGTLKGGETYEVQYQPATGEWTATGFNQDVQAKITASYNNADPKDHELSLWGRVFLFSKDGKVLDEQYGLVGHILFEPPSAH